MKKVKRNKGYLALDEGHFLENKFCFCHGIHLQQAQRGPWRCVNCGYKCQNHLLLAKDTITTKQVLCFPYSF